MSNPRSVKLGPLNDDDEQNGLMFASKSIVRSQIKPFRL